MTGAVSSGVDSLSHGSIVRLAVPLDNVKSCARHVQLDETERPVLIRSDTSATLSSADVQLPVKVSCRY